MNRDVMSVRLWLPRIEVLGVVVDAPERLAVRVASTVRRPRCPGCGTPSGRTHDRRDREIRDLEASGRPTTLVFCQRRMVCEPCGRRFMEGHRAFEGRVTARLARQLVADAREMTVNAAAKRHRVSWGLVNALVVAWAGLVAGRRRHRRCRVLLVDETSIRKRHRYVTVLVNGDTGEVLAMVPHRDSAALSGFLAAQGPKWCRRVKVVVSDGSKPYKAAIEARLGHARHVLDRFHVIRWFAAGLTAVRRDVQRRPEGSIPAFDPDVFRSRFLLTLIIHEFVGRCGVGPRKSPSDLRRCELLDHASSSSGGHLRGETYQCHKRASGRRRGPGRVGRGAVRSGAVRGSCGADGGAVGGGACPR